MGCIGWPRLYYWIARKATKYLRIPSGEWPNVAELTLRTTGKEFTKWRRRKSKKWERKRTEEEPKRKGGDWKSKRNKSNMRNKEREDGRSNNNVIENGEKIGNQSIFIFFKILNNSLKMTNKTIILLPRSRLSQNWRLNNKLNRRNSSKKEGSNNLPKSISSLSPVTKRSQNKTQT